MSERCAQKNVADVGGADEHRGPPWAVKDELPAVERLLVLALLRNDHARRWSKSELVRELTGVRAKEVEVALLNLAAKAVACVEGEHARAAPAVWALDYLDMICI